MRGAVSGRVTLTPNLLRSRAGKSYTNFCVATKDGLAACVAFGEVAESICRLVEADMNIQIAGKITEDGSYTVAGFSVPKAGGMTVAKNYKTAPADETEIDYLCRKLGGKYVEKKVREWTNNRSVVSAPSAGIANTVIAKACGSFDLKGWKELIAKLKAEAEEVWEPDYTKANWTESESGIL